MKKSLPLVKLLKSGESIVVYNGRSYHITEKDKSKLYQIKLIGVIDYLEIGEATSWDDCLAYVSSLDSSFLVNVA